MKRSELRQEWEARIADYKASGMSASKWCEAHNESIYKLRYWIKNVSIIEETVPSSRKWISVELDETLVEQAALTQMLTLKVEGVVIEVPPQFDARFLQDVVRALKSL